MVRFLRMVFELIFLLLTCREVIGVERAPRSGGCLLAVNHLSVIDLPFVFTAVHHQRMVAFVANKHRRNLLFRWVLNNAGVIWVRRREMDIGALKVALKALQEGAMLGVAPEGTRSRNGQLQAAKPGIAFMAVRAGAPIVPVVVINTEGVFEAWKHLRRPRMTLKIGPPFTLAPLSAGDHSAQVREQTDEIMLRLAAMLPEPYRGVYRDHPRLPQFLEWAKEAGVQG